MPIKQMYSNSQGLFHDTVRSLLLSWKLLTRPGSYTLAWENLFTDFEYFDMQLKLLYELLRQDMQMHNII